MDYHRNDYSAVSTGSVLRGGLSSTASVSPSSHAGLFYYSGMAMKPPDLSSMAAVKTSAGSSRTSVAVPPVPHAAQSSSASAAGVAAGGSTAKSSSSSFAAALRQLAKQAGVPAAQVNTESGESRGSSSASSASSPRESRASHSRGGGDASAPCDVGTKASSTSVARARSSPPVVTIAPTLSFNAVHYQDSRKPQGYDRPGHLHALPANGSFSGGISTGLSGLPLPPAVSLSLPATNSVPLEYFRGHPDLQTSAVSPYGHLGALRPEELLYTGLRTSLPTSTTPASTARPDEGSFHLLPPSLNVASPYHDSLWVSRASGLVPGRTAQEYLLGSRASPYLPYRADLLQQAVLEQSALAGQVHPSLYQHSLAAAQHTLRLEEQLYLERCGLLRSPSLMIPPQSYPPFAYPASSYLGYRYPTPLIPPSDATSTSELNFSRANSVDETKEKEKSREEEKAAAVTVSPTVKYPAADTLPVRNSTVASRGASPLGANLPPRKDREKSSKEKDRKKDRESRKGTVSLPSESSVRNQAKIQAVPPLNTQSDTSLASSPARAPSRCEDSGNQNAGISAQFSQSALEAMAMLQRNTSEENPTPERSESPLDLSESVKEVIVPTFHPSTPEEPVVSLLDLRERRYNQESDTDEEDDVRDISVPLTLRYQLHGDGPETKKKPAKKQLEFLHMFDLVTHSHREDVVLYHCEKRHHILRDTTPEPVEAEPENLVEVPCSSQFDWNAERSISPQVTSGKREFFLQLGMEVSSETHKRNVESSWSLIKADRLRRCCASCRLKRSADPNAATDERPVVKVPRLAVNPEKKHVDWAELRQSTQAFEEWHKADQNDVSRLATEAAFWLRHLTVPLARALTPLSTTPLPTHKEASETPPEASLPDKWPRLETVMSMYISHNQEVSAEIDFLKEHCEKLHLRLAQGQANLSRLCLSLSSLLDQQRHIENERQSLLQSANRLQETITSLQIQ